MAHYKKMEQSLSLMVLASAMSGYYLILRRALYEPHAILRFRVMLFEDKICKMCAISSIFTVSPGLGT